MLLYLKKWTRIYCRLKPFHILFQRTITGDEPKSELLPEGWNDTENYRIRYVLESKLYILHGLNTDGNLIVNLMVIMKLLTSFMLHSSEF